MKNALLDFDAKPDLNLAESGCELKTHYCGLGKARICLGDDDVLRVNNRPIIPFIHHSQSRGSELAAIDIEPELRNLQLINASIAGFLWRNPSFQPRNWADQLDINGIGNPSAGGGIIFWGSRIKQISGRIGLPILQQLHGKLIISILDLERVLSLKASAIIL